MHGGRVGTTRRGAARSVVVASVLTATLTGTLTATAGCTVASHQEPGQATAAVADALAEARSAAQATRITVEQLSRGRLTGPVADTALLDQLRALDDAELALTTLVPPDATSSDQRSTGLSAVGDVTDVVVRAREWTAARSGGDLAGADAVPPTADALLADLATATGAVDDALAAAGGP
ncbi:hypothetical protein ACFQHV_22230 [Promicromonospora thailandica]|uniref:Uncharacterized protein n=1 Tax=Promicromonospora thailandica TaxID=765201 RepID=A0A9X2JUJ0_9MICO|nr:hypothetical protein [Promicromonospora thailandica]MCP2263073.1 hypothetical protein [Promicromonospora thailandica]